MHALRASRASNLRCLAKPHHTPTRSPKAPSRLTSSSRNFRRSSWPFGRRIRRWRRRLSTRSREATIGDTNLSGMASGVSRFARGISVLLQSKAGQPLGRYFPELVAALLKLKSAQFVLDGEIVILRDGHLSFDDLLLRIHPARAEFRSCRMKLRRLICCLTCWSMTRANRWSSCR